MSVNETMSLRGQALMRTFRAALAALAEHEKTSPFEVAAVTEALIAHIRSWNPMLAAAIAPAVNLPGGVPAHVSVSVPLSKHAWYELSALSDGVWVYLHDDAGHDAGVTLSVSQIERLVRDLATAAAAARQLESA